MMMQVRNSIVTGYYQPLSPSCSLEIVVPAWYSKSTLFDPNRLHKA
jgi:hypothetical protein